MTIRSVLAGAALAALIVPATGRAQQTQPPRIRQIDRVTAFSRDTLAAVSTAVEVGGGRVFVNDILGRRLMLYDSTLANAVVVADSDPASPDAYGDRPGTLLAYRGDSALFITPASLSMLVLSPEGRIARVMAMPPSGQGGLPALIGSIFGTPGFDSRGRLVYFSPVRLQFRGQPGDGPMRMEPPDSALVVRFDFASRTLDTAAVIRIPRSRSSVNRDDRGQFRVTMVAFPPMPVDDWAVTADGRLAVIRGQDYHVDWLGADGAWSSTPRMPYGWERLDDDQKTALIDSVAAAMQTAIDSMPARMARAQGVAAAPGGAAGARTETRSGPGGPGGATVMVFAGPGGGGPGGEGGGPPRQMQMPVPTVNRALPADVPDYRPAFTQGAARADREGNLWIRTTTLVDGRPVYDIVNGGGQLVDRVQLPAFRTIAGFGNGVVFLGVRDGEGNMHLERARIR